MAKMNNGFIYEYNVDPELMDSLIGTVFAGDRKTKNFALNSILKLFNNQNNFQYQFSSIVSSEINYSSRGRFFTNTNSNQVGNFTQLIFNKEALRPIDLTALFDKLKTLNNIVIRIENPDDENIFFNFKVNQITSHTSYFVFDVEVYQNLCLGSFLNAKRYNIFYDFKENSVSNNTQQNSYFPSGW